MEQQIEQLREVIVEEQRKNEIRDKGIKREFRNVYDTVDDFKSSVNARFDAVDARFDAMESRIDKRFKTMDARLDNIDLRFTEMQVRSANSSIVQINQLIQPIPVYNELNKDREKPLGFPIEALKFWKLQRRKNWGRLAYYLQYYKLEQEVIRTARPPESSDSDSDADVDIIERPVSEDELLSTIRENPLSALSVLGNYLGVDCILLQSRLVQLQVAARTKRPIEDFTNSSVSASVAGDEKHNKRPRKTSHVGGKDEAQNVSRSEKEGDTRNSQAEDSRTQSGIPTGNRRPLVTWSYRPGERETLYEEEERSQYLHWELDSEKVRLHHEQYIIRPSRFEEDEMERRRQLQEEQEAREAQRAREEQRMHDANEQASVASGETQKTEKIPTQELLAGDEERNRRDEQIGALQSRRFSVVSR